MFRVSEATSLAMHTTVVLGREEGLMMTTDEIASELRVSRHHLSKVLQRLSKYDIVTSIRGPSGGFVLTNRTKPVTMLDVYEAIEGPLLPKTCLFEEQKCNGHSCILDDLVYKVNKLARDHLARTIPARLHRKKRE